MLQHILILTLFVAVKLSGVHSTKNPDIRAIHAADSTPAVDVYLDGDKILSNVTYGEASPFVSTILPGWIEVAVTLTGKPIQQAAINAKVDVESSKSYSFLAIGEGSSGPTKLQGLVIEDNELKPIDSFVKVRVVHAAANAPAVDIYVTPPNTPLLFPLIPHLSFSKSFPKSGETALFVPEGHYEIKIALSSTTPIPPIGNVKTVYDSGSIHLKSGSEYLIIAVPSKSPSSPVELLFVDYKGKTHFVPNNNK